MFLHVSLLVLMSHFAISKLLLCFQRDLISHFVISNPLRSQICDRKTIHSSFVSWNMKSSGKRLTLRLTCSLRRLVVTPYSIAKSESNVTLFIHSDLNYGSRCKDTNKYRKYKSLDNFFAVIFDLLKKYGDSLNIFAGAISYPYLCLRKREQAATQPLGDEGNACLSKNYE